MHGLSVGVVIIIIINLAILLYCKFYEGLCLGMEYYPIELYVYNIFFIIPLSILLSIFFFVILNKLGVLHYGKD